MIYIKVKEKKNVGKFGSNLRITRLTREESCSKKYRLLKNNFLKKKFYQILANVLNNYFANNFFT